jgi:hypothetical protein
MADLARDTGGVTGPLDASAPLRLPGAGRRTTSAVVALTLWQSPGLVILLVLAATAEWSLRKRRGLA